MPHTNLSIKPGVRCSVSIFIIAATSLPGLFRVRARVRLREDEQRIDRQRMHADIHYSLVLNREEGESMQQHMQQHNHRMLRATENVGGSEAYYCAIYSS